MTDPTSDPPPRDAPPGILGDWYEERGHPEAAILARFNRAEAASWCLHHEDDRVHRLGLELGRFLIGHGADPATDDFRVGEGLFTWKTGPGELIAEGWLSCDGTGAGAYPMTLYRKRKRGRPRPKAARG
jgi:hypothetical protein